MPKCIRLLQLTEDEDEIILSCHPLETSAPASDQLKLVEVKYEFVDERLINVLNFLSKLGIRKLFLLPNSLQFALTC